MSRFLFLERDGPCDYMQTMLAAIAPRYAHKSRPAPDGIAYYVNLEWVAPSPPNPISEILDERELRWVESSAHLPPGAGLLLLAYDCVPATLEKLRSQGIPIIDRSCPWVRTHLKRELLRCPPEARMVVLLDENHIQARNYRELLKPDALVLGPHDYEEKIATLEPDRPVWFSCYATFRKELAEKVAHTIANRVPRKDNRLSLAGLCSWSTRQNVVEELSALAARESPDEVWILCNDPRQQSVVSLQESATGVRFIRTEKDFPPRAPATVVVVVAPIPYARLQGLLEFLETKYGAKVPERLWRAARLMVRPLA